MKLNIAFNFLIILSLFIILNNTIGYFIAFGFVLLNLFFSRSIHQIWAISCIQSLIIIHYSALLGLVFIAISNIIYYLNINFSKDFQNNVVDFMLKRLMSLIIIQSSLILIISFMDRLLKFPSDITVSIIALCLVAGCFWMLLIQRSKQEK